MSPSKPSISKIIKDMFIPSGLVAVLYLMVSLTLLGLLNLRELWNISVGATVGPVSSQDLSFITNTLDRLQDKITGPSIILFWILVGCAAYGIAWIIQSVFMVAGHEFRKARYINGDEMPQRNYWGCIITGNLILAAVVTVLVAYLVLYLWLLLPAFAYQFYTGIYNHFNYEGIIDCIGAVILNAFAMYLLAILLRVTRHRWRVVCSI